MATIHHKLMLAIILLVLSTAREKCLGQTTSQQESTTSQQDKCEPLTKVDLVLVVDSSGSIRENSPPGNPDENWTLALSFFKDITDKVSIGLNEWRISLISFGNQAYTSFHLRDTTTSDDVKDRITNTLYREENTNTSGALRLARTEHFSQDYGDRYGVPNVLIIVTDGESTWDNHSTIPEAIKCHQAGIAVFSVGVGDAINKTELRLISSPPREENSNWFTTPNFQTLSTIVDKVVDKTCDIVKDMCMCPEVVENNENFWKLIAIIALIVAAIAILGLLSCSVITLTLSKRLKEANKPKK